MPENASWEMVHSLLILSFRTCSFKRGRYVRNEMLESIFDSRTMTESSNKSVLIVDDEFGIRSMLERIFKSMGYEVGTAENGVEGLKVFRQASWSVVIVDRGMPEMNGEDMTKEIKATHPNVPVILITGLPNAVTKRELYNAVLAKPFPPTRLLDLVEEVLVGKGSGAGVSR